MSESFPTGFAEISCEGSGVWAALDGCDDFTDHQTGLVTAGLVLARCEGCGAGYELDDVRRLAAGPASDDGVPLFDCEHCPASVYALDPPDIAAIGEAGLAGAEYLEARRATLPDGGPGADLVEMIEACRACGSAGVECDFHRGVAVGWDLAVSVMARHVAGERLTELGHVPTESGEAL